jgi:hypothetical protein
MNPTKDAMGYAQMEKLQLRRDEERINFLICTPLKLCGPYPSSYMNFRFEFWVVNTWGMYFKFL